MTVLEAIEARHSVRSYLQKDIPAAMTAELQSEIDDCNCAGDLHIQLITREPKAFDSLMAHYGKFSGVSNYIALVGKKGKQLEEQVGYYGERIALKAQMLGLNTCWVAMSFSKSTARKSIKIQSDEKLVCVLCLGYGATQGVPHKSKSPQALSKTDGNAPDWFEAGLEAAQLAPTAMNQQKFCITYSGGSAEIQNLGGFYSNVDLGIVKYHFEIGSARLKQPADL